MWTIMKLYKWDSMETNLGVGVTMEKGGPIGFIPVFQTKEDAIKWEGADSHHIVELIVEKNE